MNLAKRREEMRDFFNEKADGYDQVHLPMMANKEAIVRMLPEGIERVLDLGAGTGLELIPLFERFCEAEVTVVDISEEMLAALARRPFADKIKVICGDFFTADLGSGYDAVISSAALHHFTEEDKARLYARLNECLKPGGVFVNSDRCADSQEQQDELFRVFEEGNHGYRHFDTPLTAENECKLLRNVGFEDTEVLLLDDPLYKVVRAVKPE